MTRSTVSDSVRRRALVRTWTRVTLAVVLTLSALSAGCDDESTVEDERLRSCVNWIEGGPCRGDGQCFGDGFCESAFIQCVDGRAVFEWSGHCTTCAEVALLTLEQAEQNSVRCQPGLSCVHPDPEGDGERRLQCVHPARFELAP